MRVSSKQVAVYSRSLVLIITAGSGVEDGSNKGCNSSPSVILRGVEADSITCSTVTHAGARICLPDSGVSLTIPEGAISRGSKEQIYIAVLRDDRHRPKLTGKPFFIYVFFL